MPIPTAEYIRQFLKENFSNALRNNRYFNYWAEEDKIFSFSPEYCERYQIELKRMINEVGWSELAARPMLDVWFIEYLTYHFKGLKKSGWKIIIYHPEGSGFKNHRLSGHDTYGNLIKL